MTKILSSFPSPAQSAGHLYNLGTLVQIAGTGVRTSFCYISSILCFAAGNLLLSFFSKDRHGNDRQKAVDGAYALFAAGSVFLRIDGIQTNLGASLYLGGMGSAVALSKMDERLKDAPSAIRKLVDSRNIIAGAGQAASRIPLFTNSLEKLNSPNPSEQKFGVAIFAFSSIWLAADICLMFIKTRPKSEQLLLANSKPELQK